MFVWNVSVFLMPEKILKEIIEIRREADGWRDNVFKIKNCSFGNYKVFFRREEYKNSKRNKRITVKVILARLSLVGRGSKGYAKCIVG